VLSKDSSSKKGQEKTNVMGLTTDKNSPCLGKTKDSGQQECYLILSDEERAKGFVRPVRTSYVHVGKEIDTSKMRDLTDEEKERHKQWNYIGYIPEEDKDSPITGRFIKESDLKKGCGTVTTMGLKLAETYARDPKFYGGTFCCGCGTHLPVGEDGEFVWQGTNEKVGT